jgi:hypothetical protein
VALSSFPKMVVVRGCDYESASGQEFISREFS